MASPLPPKPAGFQRVSLVAPPGACPRDVVTVTRSTPAGLCIVNKPADVTLPPSRGDDSLPVMPRLSAP